MSTLNAKHIADKLFTTRHNFHMSNVINSVEEQYQELLNQRKGPEAFEISLMKTVPADVIEELQEDGFVIEETESYFRMTLPEGAVVDLDSEETVTASVDEETKPANNTAEGTSTSVAVEDDLDPNDLP